MNIAQHRTAKTNLEEDVRSLQIENSELLKKYETLAINKNLHIDELKAKIATMDAINTDRVRKYEAQIDYLENELKRTRGTLTAVSSYSASSSLLIFPSLPFKRTSK